MDEPESLFDYDPEDCEECGCSAGEFEDSCFHNGAWHCPECGATQ
jgi:hypothetical protein